MSGARNSFQLFSIGSTVQGSPTLVTPATFQSLDAREVQEIERWLKQEPAIMGEPSSSPPIRTRPGKIGKNAARPPTS